MQIEGLPAGYLWFLDRNDHWAVAMHMNQSDAHVYLLGSDAIYTEEQLTKMGWVYIAPVQNPVKE